MNELFPLAAGILPGALLAATCSGRTLRVVLVLAAVAIGFCATFVSGEWLSSWKFVFVDIPEALLASLVGVVVVRSIGRSHRRTRRPG